MGSYDATTVMLDIPKMRIFCAMGLRGDTGTIYAPGAARSRKSVDATITDAKGRTRRVSARVGPIDKHDPDGNPFLQITILDEQADG